MTTHPALRTQLAERLAALVARAQRVENALMQPMSADSEDHASEAEDDDALESEDSMVMREIASVRAAIERFDAGHYGNCVSCGGAISDARLAAVPDATLCTECM